MFAYGKGKEVISNLRRSVAGPPRVCTRSSMCVSVSCFYGTPECENGRLSNSCAFSWALFFLLLCLVQLFPFLSYRVLLCYVCCCLLEACSFLMRQKGSGSGWKRRRGGARSGGQRRHQLGSTLWGDKSIFNKRSVCGWLLMELRPLSNVVCSLQKSVLKNISYMCPLRCNFSCVHF